MNSLSIYENSSANKDASNNNYSEYSNENAQVVATDVNANQLEYLINENRRLQTIIDQYRYYEQHYTYAFHQAENLSTIVNVSDSDLSSMAKETVSFEFSAPSPTDPNNQETDVQTDESNKEVCRLNSELDSLRKEQEDLLSLLSDQGLKMQKYVLLLKSLGHEVSIIYFLLKRLIFFCYFLY